MAKVKRFNKFVLPLVLVAVLALVFNGMATEHDHGHDAGHGEESHEHESHEHGSHDHTVPEAEFNGEYAIDHVLDSHDWHLFDLPADGGKYKPVSIPLPVIVAGNGGTNMFMSSEFEHGHAIVKKGDSHYLLYKNKIYLTDEHGKMTFEVSWTEETLSKEGQKKALDMFGSGAPDNVFEYIFALLELSGYMEEETHSEKIEMTLHEVLAGGLDRYTESEHREYDVVVLNEKPLDLSVTKSVLAMLIAGLLLFLIFRSAAKFYAKNGSEVAPKGIAGFVEPLIIFVRDEIARPNIGEKKYMKFMPYLLTVFFFIWISNLVGLLPLGFNLTGNLMVTFTFAVFTAILTNINGNSHYWSHIFWMPGVPVPMKIFLAPIELIGVIAKPFALMIRLFANITAGHIVIMSLIGIIFKMDSLGWAGLSVPLTLFVSVLELLVAALQAYIFTMLSALFIGAAVEEAHH